MSEALRHADPLELTATDWDALIALLPPIARKKFEKERAARKERSERQLTMYANGEGGLTTWDPDCGDWSRADIAMLEELGRRIEYAAAQALIRRVGIVKAARILAGKS